MPAEAPAVITYAAGAPRRAVSFIDELLERLDRVACELYPAWLPSAGPIDDPAGAGAVAVRSIALRDAHDGGHFGPFLADLAERALRGVAAGGVAASGVAAGNRFAPETRAAELAKVIARSFGRSRVAILVSLPAELTPENEQVLVSAGRWLADSGGFGIWFAGGSLASADDVAHVPFRPPAVDPAATDEPVTADCVVANCVATNCAAANCAVADCVAGVVGYPAIAGRPHPASRAEQSLEAALAGVDWAAGREWNQRYQAHPLTNPIRVDLLWRAERCVVEIDGPEHQEPSRFAADRQRDVQLQLAGYAVLRFTNTQVVQHRDLVMSQLRQFLDGRRAVRTP